MRVLREVALRVFLNYFLVLVDNILQRFGIEIGIKFGLFLLLFVLKDFIKHVLGNFQHHVSKHLNQAAIGVVGESRIITSAGERLHALIVKPEIQNRVHHARHGKLRARAHTHQERTVAFAQLLAL